MTPPEAPPSKPVLVLATVLLLVTGAYGTGFWLLHDAGPDEAAFAPAAAAIRRAYQAGDLIVIAPFYATRAREYLGDLHPLAVRRPVMEDLDIRDRVWLFALFGAEEALGAQLEARGFVPAFARHEAGISVMRFERSKRARVTFDFVESFRSARVVHERGGEEIPCDRWIDQNGQGGPPGRWSCRTNRDWFYFAPEWHRMGDHLRWCLWAHPPNDGRLIIRYPDVPIAGVLAGRAGHTLNSSRRARAPVNLDVSFGDGPSQRFVFGLQDTFRPFRLRVPTSTTTMVTFAVSSPDAGANHFCFAADIRRPTEAP